MARKTLLITGASAGIGAAIARSAAADYDLALNYRNDRAGVEAVAQEAETAGARTLIVQADVGTPEGVAAIFAAVDAQFGRLDALVNNAGIIGMKSAVTDYTPQRMQEMLAINTLGTMLCAREAVLRMRAGGTGGVIVNISSAAARLGSPNQYVDYAASKAAVDTFTKGLGLEVAGEGIRVVGIRPGVIDTSIHAKSGEPDRAAELGPSLPMKRAGTAQEVADCALWLLSDRASYVTATTIDVTGGR